MSVMGIEGDFPYVLEEDTEFKPVVVDIKEAIEQSVNQRPEIKSLHAKEEAMKLRVIKIFLILVVDLHKEDIIHT